MSAASPNAETGNDARAEIIRRGLELLIGLDGVHELRIPDAGRFKTVSGYFNDLDAFTRAVIEWDGRAAGLYATINPTNPALLARAANRAKPYAKYATSDTDVVRRLRLFIDLDPKRPAGIAATDDEHAATLERARVIRGRLRESSWPEPLLIDSGNGAYLIYAIDLENDAPALQLISQVLEGIAAEFADELVKIDATVSNAARIARITGTLNAKGDDTPDRPHRRAAILEAPAELVPVPDELLRQVAAWAPRPEAAPKHRNGNGAAIDLDAFIREHGLEVQSDTPEWQPGKRRIRLAVCPFNRDHTNGSAALFTFASGAVDFRCLHDGCTGRRWRALREHLEGPHSRPADAGAQHRQGGEGRPTIVLSGRQPDELVDDAIEALVAANDPPELYVRAGAPVRVLPDEEARPTIREAGADSTLERLYAAATWLRIARERKGAAESGPARHVAAEPPRRLAIAVRERLAATPDRLPALRGVIQAPTMRPDGSILATPGYDPTTRLVYAPPDDLRMPPIPHTPTKDDLERAAKLVDEMLFDFPFVAEADHATAWALLFSIVLRELIVGRVPLVAFTAPSQGTGKGLLVDALHYIATGRPIGVSVMPEGRSSGEELRKRITAIIAAGRAVAVLDNLTHAIDAPALAAVLTADRWTDRILGVSSELELQNRTIWIATGNNVTVRGDFARRTVWCRLDAKIARPWLREGCWKHPELLAWVAEHRGELLAAVLTLARGWVVVGRPGPCKDVPMLGGFEPWRHVIGGVLGVARVPGLLGQAAEMYDEADEETPAWTAFLCAWSARWGERPISVAELVSALRTDFERADTAGGALSDLAQALPPELASAIEKDRAGVRIGSALKSKAGKRFAIDDGSTVRIERAGKDAHAKTGRWCVRCG